MDSLYNENHILGRLFRKFMHLFPQATKPTKKLLALFLIGQLCTEHFTSVRNLHKTFLSSVCDKKLNSYYHALSNDKIANTQIRQMLAKMSLSIIPESLAKEPVVIAIDDTTIAKFGKKFADVQYLYDHSIHDSKKSHGQWSLFCEPYNVCSGNGNSKRLPATNPLCSHFYRICHVDS